MTEAKTICGHDRETLQRALTRTERLERPGTRPLPIVTTAAHARAMGSIQDPAMLSDIIAALLHGHGFGVLVFRRCIFGQGAPRAQFVLLWERDEAWLDIWDGSKWRDHIELPKARALALRLLETTTTTALDVERMIGEVCNRQNST